jgi:ubiquinone/menaquinone biosynthesis C-methylase UbiE
MTDGGTARDRARMPAGTGGILDRRTLAGHPHLAALLRPGVTMLDVGCGPGAITADAADVVGPHGLAVGADVSPPLLARARQRVADGRPLRFTRADIFAMPFAPAFDVVTAARVLQWLARPGDAVASMARVTRPGGTVLVLDYDHDAIRWTPSPPPAMRAFYAAFLAWRAQAGFDNAIARRLPALFEAAGLSRVRVDHAPEIATRGDADFATRAGIWADVAATRGHQMVADGIVSEDDRRRAEADYRAWVDTDATSMTLHLDAVQGVIA